MAGLDGDEEVGDEAYKLGTEDEKIEVGAEVEEEGGG